MRDLKSRLRGQPERGRADSERSVGEPAGRAVGHQRPRPDRERRGHPRSRRQPGGGEDLARCGDRGAEPRQGRARRRRVEPRGHPRPRAVGGRPHRRRGGDRQHGHRGRRDPPGSGRELPRRDNSWLDPSRRAPGPARPQRPRHPGDGGHGRAASAGGSAIGVAPGATVDRGQDLQRRGTSRPTAPSTRASSGCSTPTAIRTPTTAPTSSTTPGASRNIGSCSLEFEQDLEMLRAADDRGRVLGRQLRLERRHQRVAGQQPVRLRRRLRQRLGHDSHLEQPGTVGVRRLACTRRWWRPASTCAPPTSAPYYAWVSGASIAAPHVSGAMALLRSAHPGATGGDARAGARGERGRPRGGRLGLGATATAGSTSSSPRRCSGT